MDSFLFTQNSIGESSCNTPKGNVNRWHTYGGTSYGDTSYGGTSYGDTSYLTDINSQLLDLVKVKLPHTQLPVFIGSTGYIQLEKNIDKHLDGWMCDSIGRCVFVLNNNLYFQRYEKTHMIMWNPLSERSFNTQLSINKAQDIIENLKIM